MSRVLLKLSGEALSGDTGFGFSEEVCLGVARQINTLLRKGHQIAIVIGGGNFWRGRTSGDMNRPKADRIGMLATVMNCIYMSDILERFDIPTRIYTPFACGGFTRLFSGEDAISDLKSGRVVFFAGGTGHPYFSTDTSTVLRALEIEADSILLAKAIDGIYDSDPKLNPKATRFDTISIDEVVERKLLAMDLSASIMCLENRMPLVVFSLNEKDSILSSVPDDNGRLPEEFSGTYVSV